MPKSGKSDSRIDGSVLFMGPIGSSWPWIEISGAYTNLISLHMFSVKLPEENHRSSTVMPRVPLGLGACLPACLPGCLERSEGSIGKVVVAAAWPGFGYHGSPAS